jgi:hypothetical protein
MSDADHSEVRGFLTHHVGVAEYGLTVGAGIAAGGRIAKNGACARRGSTGKMLVGLID